MIKKKIASFLRTHLSVLVGLVFILFGTNQIAAKSIFFGHTQSSNSTIKGKIIDADTGESIQFCSVIIENTYSGTSSNEEGDFVLKIDSIPTRLIFSHLNYKKQIVTITENADQIIKLTPLAHSLDEITLEIGEGKDNYALQLAQKAFERMTSLSNTQKFGKALYRQKAKNGKSYSEFSEIIYDIKYNASGIEDWEIVEGRYALKENSVNNRNFTLFSRLLKSIQPNTDDLIFPLRASLENYYEVKILDVLETNERKLIVLHFIPKRALSAPAFEGEIYINSSTYDVLKVVGTIAQDDVNLIKLSEKDTSNKDYNLSYEMVFKKDAELDLVLDYIKVNQEFDYYKGEVLRTHVSSESNLFLFEYYQPIKNRKLGKQFSRNASDWENLNEIGYNEKFWNDNQIVKRTPVEQEVIDAFEKGNKFESMFLNSRQQIALMQSGISDDPFIEWLGQSMITFSQNNALQKVYLHTSKDVFTPGDYLWYSAYGVFGSNHSEFLKSQLLHIDLINAENKIVKAQNLELTNGRGKGSMKIDRKMLPGVYQLRAYTNWMRNFDNAFFFSKEIEILDGKMKNNSSSEKEDKIDLQFFPEGGDAIVGLMNKIAFKAIGIDGLGKKIKGQIINSEGKYVASLNSIYNGAGSFRLHPERGDSYTAVLDDNSKYPLPMIKNDGYVMRIDNRNSKTIRIKIQASEGLKDKAFYIIGHIRGKKYYQSRLQFNDANMIDFEIPKNKLPSGIMTLTLFDQDRKPHAERILFINNQHELTIRTKLNKRTFKSKDKIVLDINVTDPYGRAVSSEFSLAVTDANVIQKSVNAPNILTHLLLQSELKGIVKNPGLHFKDQKASTRSRLDLILLTQGWRRYNWDKLEEQKNDTIKEFLVDEKYVISGIAKNMKNEILANTTLNMIAKTKDRFKFKMYSTKTKSDGRFDINTINYSDSLKLVFSAYSSKMKPIGVQVELDNGNDQFATLPKPRFKRLHKIKTPKQTQLENKIYNQAVFQQKNTDVNSNMEVINDAERLDVVNVRGKVDRRKRSAIKSKYGIIPDAVVYMEDHPTANSFLNLLGEVSGVQLQGSGRNVSVQIRNLYSPLWILDGMPIAHEVEDTPTAVSDKGVVLVSAAFKPAKTVPQLILDLNPSNIEKVEILKGASASAYGMRGAGGVILISTKMGTDTYVEVASSEFNINAYSEVKEFYLPRYDTEPKTREKPDYRTTIYWNPLVKTDSNGNATITFFNSDNAKKIQIVIEGISTYGIPGAYLKTVGD